MSTLRSTQINNAAALATVLEDQDGYPLGDPRSSPIRTDQTLLAAILDELRLIRLTLADIGGNDSPDLNITDELGE